MLTGKLNMRHRKYAVAIQTPSQSKSLPTLWFSNMGLNTNYKAILKIGSQITTLWVHLFHTWSWSPATSRFVCKIVVICLLKLAVRNFDYKFLNCVLKCSVSLSKITINNLEFGVILQRRYLYLKRTLWSCSSVPKVLESNRWCQTRPKKPNKPKQTKSERVIKRTEFI